MALSEGKMNDISVLEWILRLGLGLVISLSICIPWWLYMYTAGRRNDLLWLFRRRKKR